VDAGVRVVRGGADDGRPGRAGAVMVSRSKYSDDLETTYPGSWHSNMAMSVVLRKEDGTPVDRSKIGITVDMLSSLEQQVPMLRWLYPYGDTIFNARQRDELIVELEAANPESDDEKVVIQEIRRLCAAATRPHMYLWFIGD
jgi:hypothetical protein